MEKIYSRRKINLEKGNNKLLKITIIIIIAIFSGTSMINSIKPMINKMCSSKAKSIATMISNEEATNVMKNYEYTDLVDISRDVNGKIMGIQTLVIPINEIISDVAVRIQKRFEEEEEKDMYIRVGMLTGSKILANSGPRFKFRIANYGEIETDFRSEFKEAGINQTLHRLYLQVDCNVAILGPFGTTEEKISNQVILAENIIVGEIPDTYYNFEGKDIEQGALEMIE